MFPSHWHQLELFWVCWSVFPTCLHLLWEQSLCLWFLCFHCLAYSIACCRCLMVFVGWMQELWRYWGWSRLATTLGLLTHLVKERPYINKYTIERTKMQSTMQAVCTKEGCPLCGLLVCMVFKGNRYSTQSGTVGPSFSHPSVAWRNPLITNDFSLLHLEGHLFGNNASH